MSAVERLLFQDQMLNWPIFQEIEFSLRPCIRSYLEPNRAIAAFDSGISLVSESVTKL